MNKFNYLQIVGTTIVLSPLLMSGVAITSYGIYSSEGSEVVLDSLVVETPRPIKVDTVVVVKEVKPTPIVVPKPVGVPTPPPPKVEEVKVKKDTVVTETSVESDSTSQN